MADRILVLVPAFNCAPQIGRVLAQFAEVPAGHFEEVLVLDNCSRDGTGEAACEAARVVTTCKITVARNRENYNLGGSHKAAFAYAARSGFTHVVVLHGDDQGNIGDLLPVLERGDHRTHDACLGARFVKGARLQGYSHFRVFGNYIFNALFSAVSFRRIHDLGSGLNIFARSVFADPAIKGYADDLRFNIYFLLGMIDRKSKISFFPISWREDDQVSNVRMVSQSLRTLKILQEYGLRRAFFRFGEHREVPREEYHFEVVRVHAKCGRTQI